MNTKNNKGYLIKGISFKKYLSNKQNLASVSSFTVNHKTIALSTRRENIFKRVPTQKLLTPESVMRFPRTPTPDKKSDKATLITILNSPMTKAETKWEEIKRFIENMKKNHLIYTLICSLFLLFNL